MKRILAVCVIFVMVAVSVYGATVSGLLVAGEPQQPLAGASVKIVKRLIKIVRLSMAHLQVRMASMPLPGLRTEVYH